MTSLPNEGVSELEQLQLQACERKPPLNAATLCWAGWTRQREQREQRLPYFTMRASTVIYVEICLRSAWFAWSPFTLYRIPCQPTPYHHYRADCNHNRPLAYHVLVMEDGAPYHKGVASLRRAPYMEDGWIGWGLEFGHQAPPISTPLITCATFYVVTFEKGRECF